MKGLYTIWLIVLSACSLSLNAQLVVTQSNNAAALAEELVGSGVVVNNAQLFSDPIAQGFFDGTNANINIDSGIVLTTGRAIDAEGPNSSAGITWDNNEPGDPLLDALAGQPTQDRCELRFDVTPFSDTMIFRYVFASDEYPEYVCANFNDVFGFFVSGQNPAGGTYNNVNVALIPGTNLPVAINTVNPGVAGSQGNPANCQSLAYSQYYTPSSGSIEYDGFTRVFTAVIPVVKCQTYTLRLMIGDAVDGAWDSGVFLESGSLSAFGASVEASTDVGLAYTNIIEGCLDGKLTFIRGNNDTLPETILLQVGGTATNGVDYNTIPDSVIIPANQDTLVFPLTAYQDNISEGFEVLKVFISIPCSNEILDSAVINIVDSLSIDLTPDTTVCLGESILLQAIGGSNFSWSPPTYLNTTSISTPTSTPQQSITYTVNSQLANCSATDSVTLTVVPYPNLTVGPDTGVCTGNNLVLPASGTADNYQWTPQGFLSNPFALNPTALPLQTTTYTLVATNGGVCRDTGEVTVTVNPLPIVDAGPSQAICEGDSAVMAATGGVSFLWTPNNSLSDSTISDPFAFPTSTTIYTVTITDSNGCSRADFVQVGVIPAPTIQAGPDQVICEGTSANLTVSGGQTYAWSPGGTLSNPNIANPTATPAQTTSYIVTGTDVNGCSNTDTTTVTVSPYPTVQLSASATTVCPDDTVFLQAGGGATYSWSPATGLNDPTSASPFAVVSQPITYTVTVTDANGCSNTDSITLSTYNLPTIQSGGGDSICIGSATTLSASGGVSYLWAPGNSLSSTNIANPVATPTTTTTYTLQVTDANGCSNTDQLTVTVLPLPVANAGNDIAVCEGDPTTLNASGGTQYQWSPSAGLSCTNCASPTLVPQQNTTYTVQVTDAFGCQDTDTVRVTVTPLPATTVSAQPTGICPGSSVQLNATGGVGYQWSPAATVSNANIANPTSTPTSTTWYTVNITDVTGCVATDSVEVEVFNLPNLSAGPDQTICAGDVASLQGTGALTYSWTPATGLSNPSIANPMASPANTITYTMTGTDANGCSKTDEITITVNPLPTAQAGPDQTVCQRDIVNLSAAGGTAYTWSPSTGLSCTNCTNPVLVAQTTTNYVVQVTDNNGCIDFDTTRITVLPAPFVEAGSDTTICPNTSAQLNGQGVGTFSWSPVASLNNPSIINPVATPTGDTYYFLTVTDANGCTNTDSVGVAFFPNSQVITGPDTAICEGESVQLWASAMNQYQWTPAGTLSDPLARRPVAAPQTTTIYTVVANDNNGCSSTATQTITVNPLPDIQLAVADTSICPNTSVQLSANGGVQFNWSPAAGLSDPTLPNPVATPTTSTLYQLTVTSAVNCAADTSLLVEVLPLIPTNISPDAAICPGESIQLRAENGTDYRWSPGAGLTGRNTATPTASPNQTTQYTLVMTDSNDCTVEDSVRVTVHPDVLVDAGPDSDVFIGESLTMQGSGTGTFEWTPKQYLDNPFDPQTLVTPDSSTSYTLLVTSAEGCTAEDEVFIKVYFPTKVYVPNAFSPNGDGQNDLIGPIWFNEFELRTFQIYNRWGQLVYETNNPDDRWDGTIAGQPAPIGVYVYLLRGTGNRGEPFVKQGNITLFR